MVSGVAKRIAKATLVFCNGVLCILGLTMFSIALLIRYQDRARDYAVSILEEKSEQLKLDMVAFAVIGFMMFIVGTIAIIGAGFEITSVLRAFVILILLIGLAQLAYVITVINMKEKMKRRVYRDIATYVINYDLHSEELRMYFDEMQLRGDCCGCKGRDDYRKLRYPVPDSCPEDAQEGCCPYIWRRMKKLAVIAGCTVLAIGIVEYIAAVLACILISSIEKSRYNVKKAHMKKKVDSGENSPVILRKYEMLES